MGSPPAQLRAPGAAGPGRGHGGRPRVRGGTARAGAGDRATGPPRHAWSSRWRGGWRSWTRRSPSSGWRRSTWCAGGPSSATDGRHFDVVTARALAALPKLLGWAMPLVAERGVAAGDEGLLGSRGDRCGRRRSWSGGGPAPRSCQSSVPGSSATTVVRVVRDPGAGIGWSRVERLADDEGNVRDSGLDRGGGECDSGPVLGWPDRDSVIDRESTFSTGLGWPSERAIHRRTLVFHSRL